METFLAAITTGDIKGTHEMFAEDKIRSCSGGQLPDDHRELYDFTVVTTLAPVRLTYCDSVFDKVIVGSSVYHVAIASLTTEERGEKFHRHYSLPSGSATALGESGMWWDFKMRGKTKHRNSIALYTFLTPVAQQWKIDSIDIASQLKMGFLVL